MTRRGAGSAVVRIGEVVPDVVLKTPDGGDVRLSSLRGRPLLAVCVRYYG